MGLTPGQPLTAVSTTDGPADMRLIGAGPADVQGAASTRDGDDVVVHLPAAGRHELRVQQAADAG